MSQPMKTSVIVSLVLTTVLACGGEGDIRLTPAHNANGSAGDAGAAGSGGSGQAGSSSGEAGSAGSDAEGGSAGSGNEPHGPFIRGVAQHGRFGNVAASDNMMWDGDFEWSGLFVSQYSWATTSSGWYPSDTPDMELGSKCRSGLKCARVQTSQSIAGIGVSPNTPMTHVRAWLKPPQGSRCTQNRVALGACFGGASTVQIAATTEEPRDDGWCLFERDVPTLSVSPCVFVQNWTNDTETPLLVDDVYMGPSSASVPVPANPSLQAIDSGALEALQATLRRRRDTPPAPRPALPGRAKVVRHIKR